MKSRRNIHPPADILSERPVRLGIAIGTLGIVEPRGGTIAVVVSGDKVYCSAGAVETVQECTRTSHYLNTFKIVPGHHGEIVHPGSRIRKCSPIPKHGDSSPVDPVDRRRCVLTELNLVLKDDSGQCAD